MADKLLRTDSYSKAVSTPVTVTGVGASTKRSAALPAYGDAAPTIEQLNGLVDPKSPEELERFGGVDGLAAKLSSSTTMGISPDLVEAMRERYGINRLPEANFKSIFDLIRETLSDRTLILLLVAAAISLAVGMATEGVETGWKDGLAVIVAVAIIVAITVINDYQKERQFRALNEKKNDRQVNVVRGGEDTSVSVYDLVVGDVLQLATGDIIPADGAYIKGSAARCDESSATGESDSVKKGFAPELDPFFLSGTLLLEGDARILITSVGEESFNGRIRMALRAPTPDTPLQTKLAKLANIIGNFAIIAALFIFLAQVIKYFAINADNLNTDDSVNACVDFLVIAITIVVVAVPEGLPLAVTIALAYSMKSMIKDNNLVRQLVACETMGGATTVCSDKTGTLTQNKMTVVEGGLLGQDFSEKTPFNPTKDSPMFSRLADGLSINSTAFETKTDKGLEFVGSKTECALLQFITKFGVEFKATRDAAPVMETYPFSSKKKRMSTMVEGPGSDEMTLHVKGASEIVLKMCASFVDESGNVKPLGAEDRSRFEKKINTMATEALRTIGIAYETRPRDTPEDWTDGDAKLTLLGIVGIRDPLRPGVTEAVERCRESGVIVRMVTGDNIVTAVNIAKSCGIFDESKGHVCLEGPKLRAMSDDELDEVMPKLRVMARSAPTDKLKLVNSLQRVGEVVAVTGDGVNDGPALKQADVGFSMGITGTEVAKEASAIVLLDDNFASIVNAIKWGRNVFDAIRKFLQFQMTVNFAAILFLFIALMADPDGDAENSPLQPVQLLWINLIMDTLAAISLATEPASGELLKTQPYSRAEPLMNPYMVRRAVVQVILQVTTFLLILYLGEPLFDTERGPNHDPEDGRYSRAHHTVVFNVFVLSQMFNQFNSRKIHRQFNVFSGMQRHWIFPAVWVFALAVQILMVELGGDFVKTDNLSFKQWLFCGIAGTFPLLWTFLFNLIPGEITEKSLYVCGKLVVSQSSTVNKAKAELPTGSGAIASLEEIDGPGGDLTPEEAAARKNRTLRSGEAATPAGLWGDAIWSVLAQRQVVDAFRRHHR